MKSVFPGMLNELFSCLDNKYCLPKTLEECGLNPIDRAKVLRRIPSSIQVDKELMKR